MYAITLECFNCGKKKEIGVNTLPTFGGDVVNFAEKAGWKGVFDIKNSRAVVFCCQKCMQAATTKSGSIKLNPQNTVKLSDMTYTEFLALCHKHQEKLGKENIKYEITGIGSGTVYYNLIKNRSEEVSLSVKEMFGKMKSGKLVVRNPSAMKKYFKNK